MPDITDRHCYAEPTKRLLAPWLGHRRAGLLHVLHARRLLLALSIGCAASGCKAQDNGPSISVEKHDEQREEQGGFRSDGEEQRPYYVMNTHHYIKITDKGDALTISSLTVNRGNCDSTAKWKLPAPLQFGQVVEIEVYCDALEAVVGVNNDTFTYDFK